MYIYIYKLVGWLHINRASLPSAPEVITLSSTTLLTSPWPILYIYIYIYICIYIY